jgi:hypothetical protein
MREVIVLSSQAKILLSQGDKTQIRAFFKNVGSNFILKDKKENRAPCPLLGYRSIAEGVGFEPTGPFKGPTA